MSNEIYDKSVHGSVDDGRLNCLKNPYPNKKEARKAAKALTKSSFGGYAARFSQYHCKECNQWHTYTSNRKLMKHNSEHSRGGRGYRRR